MAKWTAMDIDSQNHKVIIITGGTSGVGLETAKVLARMGAEVIIAADDESKGNRVIQKFKSEYPEARIFFEPLDLGSLGSITSFASKMNQSHSVIDVLINNAGLSAVPERLEAHEGHELIFSANYLGHFALTAQLFPMLSRSKDPRVVFVSSLEHRNAHLNLDDLDLHENYSSEKAYAQSKLAMLMMGIELNRRCVEVGLNLKSIPVHPGFSNTHIFDRGPKMLQRTMVRIFGQKASMGALPLLFAATSIEARSGIYYGPDGLNELWGYPTEAKVAVQAKNLLGANKLWIQSERMTGIPFDIEIHKTIGLH